MRGPQRLPMLQLASSCHCWLSSSPRNQGLPSSMSSDGTQFLCCSYPCVPCGTHSGLEWAGMGGCRMEPGVGRAGNELHSCCPLFLLPCAAGNTLRAVKLLLVPLSSGLESVWWEE